MASEGRNPQRMRLNVVRLYNWVAAFLICVATIVTVRLAIECTKLWKYMGSVMS